MTGPLLWERMIPLTTPRHDAGGVQVGPLLLAIGGYVTLDRVLSMVEVLDMAAGRWLPPLAMPAAMPHSHHAIATDGVRYVYIAGGQFGPHCSPASPAVYVLDVASRTWGELPPLPASRYAGVMELVGGRLHFCGGSREDRKTPASEHWSLGVEGAFADGEWRDEVPIPRGGPHRGSAVISNEMYVFGGQEGDFAPFPGDPECHCDPRGQEDHYADAYRLDPGGRWRRVNDLLLPASHTEQSSVTFGHKVLLLGGSIDFERSTSKFELTDAMQIYDAKRDAWSIVGRYPYRAKTVMAGYWDGWLYAAGGQRDVGHDDPSPGVVVADAWRCRMTF